MWANTDSALAERTLQRNGDGWTTPTEVAKLIHAGDRRRYPSRWENLKEPEREDLINRAISAINALGNKVERRGRGNYRLAKDK